MTDFTQKRRVIFRHANGELYTISRNGGSVNPGYLFKAPGKSGHGDGIVGTEEISEVVRAALLESCTVRCKSLSDRSQSYLRFQEDELSSYKISPEIAEALGIPETGSVGDFKSTLSRQAVEGAMDAYDSYRLTGAHGEVFKAFGEPRDYWVRSTRDRENRVYPSKPLVAFIQKKTELSGGWGRRNAAARLHNAGFIIVDQDNKPVPPPERHDHLISGSERIRFCALNYCIEPARERGADNVSVRASDLANLIGGENDIPTICRALGSKEFQQLAQVPPPTHTEPNPDSSTTFTFQLGSHMEAHEMNKEMMTTAEMATNLILYGPPGTGKTYRTAWEAVRLCLGDETAASLQGYEKRGPLMAEYRRLVSDGRIEFVTFHQSMSYEEFVEGLRPETGKTDETEGLGEVQSSGGFRLQAQDGIFKRISERARLDSGDAASGSRLDRSRRIVRLGITGGGWRQAFEKALQEDRIEWPHGGEIDWSAAEYENWEAIKARRQQDDPNVRGNHLTVYGTWLVRGGAEAGDYVALTVGKNKMVAFGRLEGDYEFVPSTQQAPANHLRPVKWLWNDPDGIDRAAFYDNEFTSFHPIYPLISEGIDWDGLDAILSGEDAVRPTDRARPHVLIIDEINRANISKVLGELITLLEPDKRLNATNEIRVRLPYSKKRFSVPANLHIIGTMNTADRSIALLDTALRRRFTFKELMPDPSTLPTNLGGIDLQKLLTTINDRIEYLFDREHQIGHAYFTGCRSRADVDDVMRHKVIPLLAEYFYEDWSKVAAVLGDGPGTAKAHFLESISLQPPKGMPEDDLDGDKRRWSVKPEFDFSEFDA